nr:hypothetical protein [Streptomyces sp. ISL-111]
MLSREVVAEEVRQLSDLLGEVLGVARAAARGGGRGVVGARGAAQAQVDAAGGEGVEHAELFGDDQRRVVGQHDPARAEPQSAGLRGEPGHRTGGLEVETPGMAWCSFIQ